jgi:hypothetical protein
MKAYEVQLGCAPSSSEIFGGVQYLEVNMKKLVLAAALAGAASTAAYAGGVAEPVMEPVVVEEQTSS